MNDESHNSYLGHLLLANPNNPKNELAKSVVMLVTHTPNIAVGLQLNNPHEDLTIGRISKNIGIDHEGDQPIYFGGQVNTHKIHILHSMDWCGLSTVELAPNIGLTNDISVLAAMARSEGPSKFRACAGYWLWESGKLDNELYNDQIEMNSYRWELIQATEELVFDCDPYYQWQTCIEAVAKKKFSQWF
jgi:putative AlgH/UPF0301 family transcriptional regulator